MMINFILEVSSSAILNQFQPLVLEYVQAITDYVLAFVRFIMPLMIYIIVFRIVLTKS
jgi:hypothetical protein